MSRHYDFDKYHNEVLKKYPATLEAMVDNRIFSIEYDSEDDEYVIREMCDEYFGNRLSSEMCLELSRMFYDIASDIKNKKK